MDELSTEMEKGHSTKRLLIIFTVIKPEVKRFKAIFLVVHNFLYCVCGSFIYSCV